MLYNLFLDDLRYPVDCFEYTHLTVYLDEKWVIVRNYDEFVKAIQEKGIPEMISFDHDLADEHYVAQDHIEYGFMTEKTGYHCAMWLINYCIDNNLDIPKYIFIHSMNPVGGSNIASAFNTYKKVYGK